MSERKKVFDMVPKKKRKSSAPMARVTENKVRYFSTLEKKWSKGKKEKRHPFALVGAAVFCVLAIALSFQWVSATAEVTIVPKTNTFSLDTSTNATFIAYKDATSTDALLYQLIETHDEIHTSVSAISGPLLETKARGTVILYNTFSTDPQKIIQGTRLSNSEGKLYSTLYSITIPGYTKTAKGIAAGSFAVSVIAEKAGVEYNILPTDLTGDFKVLAYKGTLKYDVIYGRLSTKTPIGGGFVGQQQIVASSTLAATYASLQLKLQENLITRAQALIPADYILFGNAYSIDYSHIDPSLSATPASSSGLDVGVKGIFHGVLFRKHDLVHVIAKRQNIDMDSIFPNDSFVENNMPSLSFIIMNQKTFSIASSSPLSFTLRGSFSISGVVPLATLAKQLTGKDTSQSKAIFDSYSQIATHHATIHPFWRHTFPDSSNRIKVSQ